MNKLFVGIDVGSRGNATYLMKPDGGKHCVFSVENNMGGAKLLTDKASTETIWFIISGKMVAWADTSERSMCSTPNKSRNSRNPILIYRRMTLLTHL